MVKNKTNTVRKSGVELFKIVAMILICISHCVQTTERFIDFQLPTTDWQMLVFRILRFFGNIGNIIFVVCSSYFLVDSPKSKKDKAINILLDSQIISIGIFVSFIAMATLFKSEFHFSIGEVLNNIFPNLFGTVWFVPCYVIFYLAHPAFNIVIKSLSQKQHLGIVLFIIIFYGLSGLIEVRPCYSSLLGFVFIYFIVAYMKRYCQKFIANKRKNLFIFLFSLFVFIATVVIKNFMSLKINYFETYPDIGELTSIIFLPMIISLFNLFISMNFRSRFVNYIASCSLFFYCIHENWIIRNEIRPMYYSFLLEKFGEEYILLYMIALVVILLIAGFTAAAIYKQTFSKLTKILSIKIKDWISPKLDWILEKSNKI